MKRLALVPWRAFRLPAASLVALGPAVEPALWDILDNPLCQADARGLAAATLQKLFQNQAIPRLPALHALAGRLQPGRTENTRVNADIVFVLNRLDAVEVKDAILGLPSDSLKKYRPLEAIRISTSPSPFHHPLIPLFYYSLTAHV